MDNERKSKGLEVKKCYNCYTYLALDAEECYSCKKKVGKANKYGIAKQPTDWTACARAFLMWSIFGLFIWWKFFRDK